MCKVQIKTKATEKKYCSYILNYDKMCNFAMQNTSLTEKINSSSLLLRREVAKEEAGNGFGDLLQV